MPALVGMEAAGDDDGHKQTTERDCGAETIRLSTDNDTA